MRAASIGKLNGLQTKIWCLILVCGLSCLNSTSAFASSFLPAIACVTNIDLDDPGAAIDSFDSSNPNYSDWNTNRGYGIYDPNKDKANAIVETDSDVINAIYVGGHIYGAVNTGLGGAVMISPTGYVGPIPQIGTGIQPGCSNDTANITFPDVPLPPGTSGWQTISDGSAITNSGNYFISGITAGLTIAASNVTIYVNGNISMSGSSAIFITTNVNHVTMYVAGPSLSIIGLATINNVTQHASALGIYGLPSLTSIRLSGNNAFTGTIYAPEADLSLAAGGNNGIDVVASFAAHSLIVSGRINFHLDESLAANPYSLLWFTAPAQNVSTFSGYNATLSTPLQGQPMSYQWYFNQTNLLAGATNLTLTITNAQFSDAGPYSLVAANFAGAVTSAPVNLLVYSNLSMEIFTPSLSTNGVFTFAAQAPPGLTLTAQASTNMIDWVSIGSRQTYSIFSNVWLQTYFADRQASNYPQRYYRVVFDPQ